MIGGLESIEPADSERGRRRQRRLTPVATDEPMLPMWLIALRVAGVVALATVLAGVILWLRIATSGDETEGTINAGNVVTFSLATAGMGFSVYVVPALVTVLGARFAMARSKHRAWLVVGIAYLALFGLTLAAGAAILGGGLLGQALVLALPSVLVSAVVMIAPAPWFVRPLRRGAAG